MAVIAAIISNYYYPSSHLHHGEQPPGTMFNHWTTGQHNYHFRYPIHKIFLNIALTEVANVRSSQSQIKLAALSEKEKTR